MQKARASAEGERSIGPARKPGHRARRPVTLAIFFLLVLTFAALPATARAAGEAGEDLSLICDRAAALAAARTGVPISVLKAIALTETGRKRGGEMRPWPWTVNMEGKGVWFASEAEALAYAKANFDRGARSFDVGCFQINYRWHHQHFASLEEMFDPDTNALYAARFLAELFAKSGSWTEAAGAYHSNNPTFADRYKARFARYRAKLTGEDGAPLQLVAADPGDAPEAPPPPPARVRVNNFPLLKGAGGETSLGSLVPLDARGAPGALIGTGLAG